MRDVCDEHESLVISLTKIEAGVESIEKHLISVEDAFNNRLLKVEDTLDTVREKLEGLRGQANAHKQTTSWAIAAAAVIATIGAAAINLVQ